MFNASRKTPGLSSEARYRVRIGMSKIKKTKVESPTFKIPKRKIPYSYFTYIKIPKVLKYLMDAMSKV